MATPTTGEPTLDEVVDRFTKHVESELCLDESRLELVRSTGRTLHRLVRGQLAHENRIRRMLLGRKGSGKTALLDAMQAATREVFPEIVVVKVEYDDVTVAETLLAHLERAVPSVSRDASTHEYPMKALNAALTKAGVRVFLVVDEVQNVYLGSCKCGETVVGELAVLGGLPGNAIHAIISGSGSVLRALATGKLEVEKKGRFTHYSGLDLNGTKFLPWSIWPFLNKEDFARLCDSLAARQGVTRMPDMRTLYLQSGGLPFDVAARLRGESGNSEYATAIRTKDPEELGVLRKVFDHLTARFDEGDGEDPIYQYTDFVVADPSDAALLYKLVDSGHVRLRDTLEWRVSLASPNVYLGLMRAGGVTAMEKASLLVFSSAAEAVIGRLFSQSANLAVRFGCGKFQARDIVPLVLDPEKPKSIALSCVANRVLKECLGRTTKDALGADFVVIASSGKEAKPTLHRIQLKIGTSTIDENEAKSILHRFDSMTETTRRAYTTIDMGEYIERRYLATTRGLHPNAVEAFKTSGVTVLDRKFLSDNVWPDEVKELRGVYQ